MVRDCRAPDTPRTAEARSFMDGSAPAQGADCGLGRYRRGLDENDARADGQKWPDKSMQKAAGIAPADAKTVRDFRAPDTPRTIEARLFMNDSAPAQGEDSGSVRYRRGLNENDRRADGQKWPDKSLQKAAGLAPSTAKRLRNLHAPDTPRTAQARLFMDGSTPAQGADTGFDRYRRGLDENDRRADGQKWPDKSLRKAAGIDRTNSKMVRNLRAPDTPRTAEARLFMEGSAPAQGADSALGRYRRGLNENDRRADGQKWPDKSMQKAAGIAPAHAKMVRDCRAPDTPRTAEARSFMDGSAPAQGADSGLGRYRRLLDKNDTRADGQKWPDKSMQKAAGIAPVDAKTVRDFRAPDTPRTTEARLFLNGSAPAQGADSGFDRYHRVLDENDTREDGQKWPDKSMQKAAGIAPSHARTVRNRRITGHGDPVP
ncbi:MAG: hypothetical protein JF606_23750 [Burkholderiales bacterium]|nr:hypothetical protein [Burkholderiales bacterium]